MATDRPVLVPLDGGEIVWIDFDPVRGTEQAGARPALVLSETSFNAVNRRAIVCPISSRRLLDQVRTVDRLARGFRPICTVPAPFLARVRILVGRLIGLQDQTF
jgi:mRNA interferase MazF